MRHLTLHRQRALVGFALKYYCVLTQQETPEQEETYILHNGDTISVEVSENGASFFVAVLLENRQIFTEPIAIAPGTVDVSYVILTDAHQPYKGMGIAVVPAE